MQKKCLNREKGGPNKLCLTSLVEIMWNKYKSLI